MSQPSTVLDRVEQEKSLDPVVKQLSGISRSLLPSRALRDLLHGTWLGHPLHPMLTDVPIGAWTCAALLDLLGPDAENPADLLVALGVVAAVPTAASGLADWSETNPQQQRVGLVHAAWNSVGLGCYLASLVARRTGGRRVGRMLGLAGLGAVAAGGFVGGHLSYRQANGANHAEDIPNLFPSGWQRVCALLDLPNQELSRHTVGEVNVVLLRRGDDVLALADKCSHMSGPLSEGQLTYDGGQPCVQCPWHASVFRLTDGSVVHGPATSPQPRLEVQVVDGQVEVRLG